MHIKKPLAQQARELLLSWSQRDTRIVYSPEYRQLLALATSAAEAANHNSCGSCDGSGLATRLEHEQEVIHQCCACKGTGKSEGIEEDVKNIVGLLQEKQWAEHCTKSALGRQLELAVTDLISGISARKTVLPPCITFESKGFRTLTSDDIAYNRALSEVAALNSYQQSVSDIKYPHCWHCGRSVDRLNVAANYHCCPECGASHDQSPQPCVICGNVSSKPGGGHYCRGAIPEDKTAVL